MPFFLICWATTFSFQLNQLIRAWEVLSSAPSWTSKAAKPLGYWRSWRMYVVPVVAQHNVMTLHYCCLPGMVLVGQRVVLSFFVGLLTLTPSTESCSRNIKRKSVSIHRNCCIQTQGTLKCKSTKTTREHTNTDR